MYDPIDLLNSDTYDSETESSNAYTTLLLLAALTATIYTLARSVEYKNHLDYESRTARIIAGYLVFIISMLHLDSNNKKILNPPGSLYALGPHRTGKDALAFAVTLEKGTPPRFMVTDAFNNVPGLKKFMELFKAIFVPTNSTKGANAEVIEQANQALRDNDCVAIFPQGGFSLSSKEPRTIYSGVAKIALETKKPIRVIRLDGFSSLNNPLIPLTILNNSIYRAFGSIFHPDNISVRECHKIDFHLKPEHEKVSYEEKITEICAQLYAFFAHTENLTDEEISNIQRKVASGTEYHHSFWNDKVRLEQLNKERIELVQKLHNQEDALKKPLSEAHEQKMTSLKPTSSSVYG